MTDNAQKLSLPRNLSSRVTQSVLDHIQLMSGRAPASLVSVDRTGTLAMIKFETNDKTYTLPRIQVPIHGSEFTRRPWQTEEKDGKGKGARGFVSTADLDVSNMTGLGQSSGPAEFVRPANLAGLTWNAIGNKNFTAAIDPNAHESYGRDGGTITHDGTRKSQVTTHKDNGTQVAAGGDGQGSFKHTVTAKEGGSNPGVAVKTPDPHTIDAKNAQLDATGNLTPKGNISTPTGNISAPGGQVSGMSGSFLSGVMGGLKMLGGIFSGGGGGGSPIMSIDSNTGAASFASVLAPIVQTVPLTVAQLLASYPAGAALVGARAFVTDSTTASFYQVVTSGGGPYNMPVFCQSQASGGTTVYRWVSG